MNEMALNDRIESIIEIRRKKLPAIERFYHKWKEFGDEMHGLERSAQNCLSHPEVSDEIKTHLLRLDFKSLSAQITYGLELLDILKNRFSRDTINIGVSGKARVGKSTLLQAISGLNDEQIPTGSGIPVTAVRSRIFHSKTSNRAVLSLHSFASFRQDVLEPYHKELGLGEAPNSIAEFGKFSYLNSEQAEILFKGRHSNITIVNRLRDMQRSLGSFEKDLIDDQRTVDLEELRPYVAYPTSEEEHSEQCSRRYLAVKDARIECCFPLAQVERLGIIDLPGLGELTPDAEKHHLQGLQNEVDVVLFVKRAVEGMAYWGAEDGRTANMLDEARGFVSQRKDFVFVVINNGNASERLINDLRGDIRKRANENIDGKHYFVLEANVADQGSVYENILNPVLEHLAQRLSVMDQEIIAGVSAQFDSVQRSISEGLALLQQASNSARRAARSSAEELEELTAKLRDSLAFELASLVSALQERARCDEGDEEYITALEQVYEDVLRWISDGFGLGVETWQENAHRRMITQKGSAKLGEDEANSIRVELSKRFANIDKFFDKKVSHLKKSIFSVLKDNLGELVAPSNGDDLDGLERFSRLLEEAEEPSLGLKQAVDELIALKLEYKAHLHPRVRSELDGLASQIKSSADAQKQVWRFEAVSLDDEGAKNMYRFLSQIAEQAAYNTKKALLAEANLVPLVLHATAEQFEDALIRSASSEREFRRLGRSYCEEIWVSKFSKENNIAMSLSNLRKAISSSIEALAAIQQERL